MLKNVKNERCKILMFNFVTFLSIKNETRQRFCKGETHFNW